MKFKCLVLSLLLFIVSTANCASLYGSIPVRIIYENSEILRAFEQSRDLVYNANAQDDLIPEGSEVSKSIVESPNLPTKEDNKSTEKPPCHKETFLEGTTTVPKLTTAELLTNVKDQEPDLSPLKNLEEKPQLSENEQVKSEKYAQILNDVLTKVADEKDNGQVKGASVSYSSDKKIEEELKTALNLDDDFSTDDKQPLEDAKNVIYKGISDIRHNVEKHVSENTELYRRNPPLNDKHWKNLNNSVDEIFSNSLKTQKLSVKDLILPKFNEASTQFLSELRQSNASFPQNILSFFQNGFQSIQSSLSGETPPVAAASDTEATSPRPNPVQSIVNQVQQFFQPNKNPGNLTLSDGEQNPVNRPVQAIQSAFNQFSQSVSGLNPFNQQPAQAPATSQNDPPESPSGEGPSSQTPPLQAIQNVFGQFQQGISNLNPFKPTSAPGAQSDEGSTPNALVQTFQNVSNQFSQAINNLNPFKPSQNQASAVQSDEQPTQNGIVQTFQNVSSQFSQAISNLNPFRPTQSPGSQSDEQTSRPSGIIGTFQNASNQFSQAINNLNPFNRLPTQPSKDATIGTSPKPPASDISLQASPESAPDKPAESIVKKPSANDVISTTKRNIVVETLQSQGSEIRQEEQATQKASTSLPEKQQQQQLDLIQVITPSIAPIVDYQVEIIPSPGVEIAGDEKKEDVVPLPQTRIDPGIIEMIPSISVDV